MSDSNDAQPQLRISSRRRGVGRILYTLAVACSCLFFACAGCCFLTTWVLRPNLATGAAEANEAAAQITDWKVPDAFEGKLALTADNFVVRLRAAQFVQKEGRGFIVIVQTKVILPQPRRQLQEMVERQIPEMRRLRFDKEENRASAVRGAPAEFEIGHGEDLASTTRYVQVVGHFRGKSDKDDAIVILQCEEGILTDVEIDEFVNSIK